VLEQNADTVKIVFKHFPLSFHAQAQAASLASIAAHKQGKFWQYHDLLYENHKTLTTQSYETFATQLGLDLTAFNRDRQSAQARDQIKADINIAKDAGVSGTPAIFVNGHRVNQRSLQVIQSMIDEELKKR
jgi:protein-disulfide isomerase